MAPSFIFSNLFLTRSFVLSVISVVLSRISPNQFLTPLYKPLERLTAPSFMFSNLFLTLSFTPSTMSLALSRVSLNQSVTPLYKPLTFLMAASFKSSKPSVTLFLRRLTDLTKSSFICSAPSPIRPKNFLIDFHESESHSTKLFHDFLASFGNDFQRLT